MTFCSKLNLDNFKKCREHYVQDPDGRINVYDVAISEYVARRHGLKVKSNEAGGSSIVDVLGTINDLTVKYRLYEFEFNGSHEIHVDGEFIANGKLIQDKYGNIIFVMDTLKATTNAPENKIPGRPLRVRPIIPSNEIHIPIWRELTMKQAEDEDFYAMKTYQIMNSREKLTLIEATAKELADKGISAGVGIPYNHCFDTIALKYPNLKVRGRLNDAKNEMVDDIEVFVKNDRQGLELEELFSIGAGPYRYDGDGCGLKNEWALFTTF